MCHMQCVPEHKGCLAKKEGKASPEILHVTQRGKAVNFFLVTVYRHCCVVGIFILTNLH